MNLLHRLTGILLLSALLASAFPALDPLFGPSAMALADDDDDDDGDDDSDDSDDRDDRDDDNSRDRDDDDDDRRRPRADRPNRVAPPAVIPAPRPQPLPQFAPEIVVRDMTAEDLLQLLDEGYTVLDAQPLPSASGALIRLAAPPGTALESARDRVRLLPSGAEADLNHFYRAGQSQVLAAAVPTPAAPACSHENCGAWQMIGWPEDRDLRPDCRVTVPVGVMDTGVNLAHDILQGARVEVLPDVLDTRSPSAAVHGTAVVSLLAGNPGSRVPGLIPEAQILAVDVFSSAGQDERADVVALLRGLDALAARGVRIVNLSLAGPANTLLESTLARLRAERGMIFVAAAGNGGPEAAPAYPAAYAGVLAITAVDQRGRPYRQAQRGPHLDAAAPGVNLLAATSVRGAAAKSGTSFATPFATAALALYLSRDPAAPVEAVEQRLLSQLRDIGAAGADDIHGGGLLSLTDLCG